MGLALETQSLGWEKSSTAQKGAAYADRYASLKNTPGCWSGPDGVWICLRLVDEEGQCKGRFPLDDEWLPRRAMKEEGGEARKPRITFS